jgi:hypothetical protein
MVGMYHTEHLKSQLDHHHVETGTTDWFNYMDIRVRPETALGIVGY